MKSIPDFDYKRTLVSIENSGHELKFEGISKSQNNQDETISFIFKKSIDAKTNPKAEYTNSGLNTWNESDDEEETYSTDTTVSRTSDSDSSLEEVDFSSDSDESEEEIELPRLLTHKEIKELESMSQKKSEELQKDCFILVRDLQKLSDEGTRTEEKAAKLIQKFIKNHKNIDVINSRQFTNAFRQK